jgi:hypothetical protein
MPPFYIGSTSVDNVADGYHGTVLSAKYKSVWREELKENSHLFKTKVVSIHDDRQEALDKEKALQRSLNVAKSGLYINQALATGCFGNMGEEALVKMRITKKIKGKIVGAKISAIRNNPEWKATIGKQAAIKLSHTKKNPNRAHIEAERNRKNSATINSEKWKNTVGAEKSRKISAKVRELMSQPNWAEKELKRKNSLINTLNSEEYQSKQKERNIKRSLSVSKTKSNPEWKVKNSTECLLCRKTYANNVISRHIVKCKKDKDNLSCHT